MNRPKCKTCPYYDDKIPIPIYDQNIGSFTVMQTPKIVFGGCRLQPHATPHKTPDEWCSKHPQMAGFVIETWPEDETPTPE